MKLKLFLFFTCWTVITGCATKPPVNGWEQYFCNMEYINNVYLGILVNNATLKRGSDYPIQYEFDTEMGEKLEEKYHLKDIAGQGGDFDRALGLMNAFAPRLAHGSSFDNHIEFNALSILEYSLDKPEKGINCLNKSKALMEMCLSQGIYSRKVSLYPYNPLDQDNHVVVEIYSHEWGKWVMLDPSSDIYCQNGRGEPMSLMEIRNSFVSGFPFTIVSRNKNDNPIYLKTYLMKNLVFLVYDSINGFGERDDNTRYFLQPVNFNLEEWFTNKYPERENYYHNYDFKTISPGSVAEGPMAKDWLVGKLL